MALSIPVPELVKKSRDPLLKKHPSWKRIPLDKIAEVTNGFAFPSSNFSKEKGFPLLRIRDIKKHKTECFYDGDFDPTYIVKKGDLVVGMDGDFNSTRWKGEPALLNQRVCRVRVNSEIYDEKFLHYVLPAYLNAINRKTSSVTVKHLSSKSIKQIPLPLPPINEQKRIVEKIDESFTKLESSISNINSLINQLEIFEKSFLKSAIDGILTDKWRKKRPTLKNINKINSKLDNPNLAELPEGWQWVYLSEIGELNRGKSKHRPRNDPILYGGNYPFIQTGDIRKANNEIKKYSQTYNEAGLKQSKLWEKDTLCITIAANIAETAILKIKACFPDSIVGFRPEKSVCDVNFIHYFFKTIKEELNYYAPATAQKNINLGVLRKVMVPLPHLNEQHIIVDKIENVLSILNNINRNITSIYVYQSKNFKFSILKKAFEGSLVSQDPSDEPADELLKRIKTEKGKQKQMRLS